MVRDRQVGGRDGGGGNNVYIRLYVGHCLVEVLIASPHMRGLGKVPPPLLTPNHTLAAEPSRESKSVEIIETHCMRMQTGIRYVILTPKTRFV